MVHLSTFGVQLIRLVTERGELRKPLTRMYEWISLPLARFLWWAEACNEAMHVVRLWGCWKDSMAADKKEQLKNREDLFIRIPKKRVVIFI